MEPFRLHRPRFSRRHLAMNWNFNRWFLLLGWRLRISSPQFRLIVDESQRPSVLSSRFYRSIRNVVRGKSDPGAIIVASHGRFGNSIRTVAHALAVAEKMGVPEVVAKSVPQLPRGSWLMDTGVTLTHDPLLRPQRVPVPRTVLGGDFFVEGRLPTDLSAFDFAAIGRGLQKILTRETLRPLPDDVLVIHIRSGDAFGENPNPGLSQPPMSFYLEAYSRIQPSRVVMVFEDEANPVIGQLRRWFQEKNISVVSQSSDFSSDLSVLLKARSLVLARGTLGSAIILLSTNLRRVAVFGGQNMGSLWKSSPLRILRVVDDAGQYSRDVIGKWSNNAHQRELMSEYPQHYLAATWEDR